MKKGAKITLIVVPIILVLLGSTFGGTLLYSKDKVTYDVGDPNVTVVIIQILYLGPPYFGYTGKIIVDVPLDIYNDGLYSINDLVISAQVYGQNFNLSSLNGALLGGGTNVIGDVKHSSTWSGYLEFNITSNIVALAISEGELRIEVQMSLKVNFLVYNAPINYNETHVETWEAPYTDIPDPYPF